MSTRALGLAFALGIVSCGGSPMRPVEPAKVATPPSPKYDEHDLLLEPVSVYDGGIWFADELAPIADAIAQHFENHPEEDFRPIEPAKLRALWKSVREGRLPGVAGVCAAAPPPSLLGGVLHEGASTAEASIDCEGDACMLEVIVRRSAHDERDSDDGELARYQLALPKPGSPSAWVAAIRSHGLSRVPKPEEQAYGGLGLGGIGNGVPGTFVEISSVDTTGPWSTPPTSDLLQPRAEALHACTEGKPTFRDWWAQPFLLDVAADGHATRCEDEHPDHLLPNGFACQCDVLRSVDFGPANAPRRARFYLRTWRFDASSGTKGTKKPDPFRRSAYLLDRTADDRSAILGTGDLDEERARVCLDQVSQPIGSFDVPVRFTVGPQGHVAAHETTWPKAIDRAELVTLRTCLDAVLADAQFDCPLTGVANVRAILKLTVEPWK